MFARKRQERRGALQILVFFGLYFMPWSNFAQNRPPAFVPDIPKVWDDAAMRDVELPLASRIPVQHIPSDYYYRIPVRPNLKTYPIYVPGKEPQGYWERLLKEEPQAAFDEASLHTRGRLDSRGRNGVRSATVVHGIR